MRFSFRSTNKANDFDKKNMLKLSKKIEYGILATQHMAKNPGSIFSAKEMSEVLNISYEFLSKTLQKLMKKGIIKSRQGYKGGYSLARDARKITVADIMLALEANPALVQCFVDEKGTVTCGRAPECEIQSPMYALQRKIDGVFRSTTVEEIANASFERYQKLANS